MPRKTNSRLSPAQAKLIAKARVLGNGKDGIRLNDVTMAAAVGFLERDLARPGVLASLPDWARPTGDFHAADPLFASLKPDAPFDLEAIFIEAADIIEDSDRAIQSLCEIVKRKQKVVTSLAAQPLPQINGIAFRTLLDDGVLSPTASSSYARWRKFLYDIDNRIAQQTAYAYTAVIRNCLRGRTVAGRHSPIRRTDDNYARRLVDCLVGDRAYDFKGRLTEAPSRRARFDDELAFPRDCYVAGYRPFLLSFAQQPGERAEELVDAYARNGGEALIGDAAWAHLRAEAGPVMSRFLDHYVTAKVEAVCAHDDTVLDMTIRMRRNRLEVVLDGAGGRPEAISVSRVV